MSSTEEHAISLPAYVPLPPEWKPALEVLNRKMDTAIDESKAAKDAAGKAFEASLGFDQRLVKLEKATSPILAANRYATLFATASVVNLAIFAMLLYVLLRA